MDNTHTDPARFIDDLLQDAFLFVMDVLHDKQLVRDDAFYRRGCALVDNVKEKLAAAKASDEFTHQVLQTLCAMLDYSVLNSASNEENTVWRGTPLEGAYLGTLRAGDRIPEALRQLLRQPAPDMRLLVLYQRLFATGYGALIPGYADERRQVIESLDALVPPPDLPQSTPLITERRPGIRRGLMHSRLFYVFLLVVLAVALYSGLDYTLQHYLHTALPG